VPCLDTPSSAVALEGTDDLEMNLVPRVRHRNQYQKTTGGLSGIDKATRRGLSLSSHEGESKISAGGGGCSPEVLNPSDHSFSTLHFSQTDEGRLNDKVDGALPSPGFKAQTGGASPTPATVKSAAGVGQSAPLLLTHSISVNEQMDADAVHRTNLSGRPLPHSRWFVGDKTGNNDLQAIENQHYATEPQRSTAILQNIANGSLPPSLGSRVDSDYCSQHSKDFTLMGCE